MREETQDSSATSFSHHRFQPVVFHLFPARQFSSAPSSRHSNAPFAAAHVALSERERENTTKSIAALDDNTNTRASKRSKQTKIQEVKQANDIKRICACSCALAWQKCAELLVRRARQFSQGTAPAEVTTGSTEGREGEDPSRFESPRWFV